MHLPEANLPVTRSLSTRMARWGLVIGEAAGDNASA